MSQTFFIGGTFLASLIGTSAQAATFTVEFEGLVDSLVDVRAAGAAVPPLFVPVNALTTTNTDKSVELTDRLTGRYIFDDSTGELLSARFRFVSPDSGISLDPAVTSVSDIVFDPTVELEPVFLDPPVPSISTSSQANKSSFSYSEEFRGFDSGTENIFSLFSDMTFSYTERFGGTGFRIAGSEVSGMISSLEVVDQQPPLPEEPTPAKVPEPNLLFGLFAVAGILLKKTAYSDGVVKAE